MPASKYEICNLIVNNPGKCQELVEKFQNVKKLTATDIANARDMNKFGEDYGWRPLHLIMRVCHGENVLDLVQYIVNLYPDSVKQKTFSDQLPIDMDPGKNSYFENQLEARLFLIRQYPECLNERLKDKRTVKTRLEQIISWDYKILIKAVVKEFPHVLKQKNPDGLLPLHFAIREGKLDAAEILFLLYPQAIVGGPSLGSFEKNMLVLLEKEIKARSESPKTPDLKLNTFLSTIKYLACKKNKAKEIHNRNGEIVKGIIESEDKVCSAVQSNWPIMDLKNLIRLALDDNKNDDASAILLDDSATREQCMMTIRRLCNKAHDDPILHLYDQTAQLQNDIKTLKSEKMKAQTETAEAENKLKDVNKQLELANAQLEAAKKRAGEFENMNKTAEVSTGAGGNDQSLTPITSAAEAPETIRNINNSTKKRKYSS